MKFRWETEFKETEIGEIPKDWEVEELGKLFKVKNGKRPHSVNNDDEYEIWGANGLMGYTSSYNETGELLVTGRVGTLGNVFYITAGYKIWVSDNAIIMQRKDNNSIIKFYFYHLSVRNKELIELNVGSTQPLITQRDLKNIKVPYPPTEEQTRIATVLSWFDDLIENKRKQNEILEKMAMAIFKSWFIDFEPFQDEEFVYSEELDMEIPEGWEVDFTTKIIDYNPSIKLENGKVYSFVEMKDVKTNSMVCEFSFKEFSGSGIRYRGGDTLMARITPSLEHGKTAFVWFISENEKGFGTTEFFVLHPKKSWLKEFVYLLAKNEEFREVAINSMTGTSGRQRADVNALKEYKIPIPPQPILQRFHSLVEPIFQKILLNQKQIMVLKKIRDTLLPQLVFGRLRVEEI